MSIQQPQPEAGATGADDCEASDIVVWHGTARESALLHAVIHRYRTCPVDEPCCEFDRPSCPAHAIAESQCALDVLLFTIRIAKRLAKGCTP